MNSLKYPEKRYLSEYDLSLELFNELDVEIIDIIPLRKVFILITTDGKKILKRVEYGRERLEFISNCITQLNNKCGNLIAYKVFSDGKCYKQWKGSLYILMELIEGRELTFTNPVEYKGAAKVLANFHMAGNEILKNDIISKKLIDKSTIIKFKEAIEELSKIENWVSGYKYKNEFDKLFLENVKEAVFEMTESINLLQKSNYEVDRYKAQEVVICHNDLAQHNFIINDDKINLIDFDYLTIDLRIMDIADLILKGIKNVAFDFEKQKEIIEEYNKVYRLKDEEYNYIYNLLLFPTDFYSIVKNYYYKEKLWDEDVYINRLKNKINSDKFRREFLKELKS